LVGGRFVSSYGRKVPMYSMWKSVDSRPRQRPPVQTIGRVESEDEGESLLGTGAELGSSSRCKLPMTPEWDSVASRPRFRPTIQTIGRIEPTDERESIRRVRSSPSPPHRFLVASEASESVAVDPHPRLAQGSCQSLRRKLAGASTRGIAGAPRCIPFPAVDAGTPLSLWERRFPKSGAGGHQRHRRRCDNGQDA
jgi:hypothetical protein